MSDTLYKSPQHYARPLHTFSAHTRAINTIAYLPDGRRLVTGSNDTTVRIWAVEDGMQDGKEMVHAAAVSHLVVTSDGRMIVCSDDMRGITTWGAGTHELIQQWKHTEAYPRLTISGDDRLVAYGLRTIFIRELIGGHLKQEIKSNYASLTSLCLSPDGSKLARGGLRIEIYSVESGQLIHSLDQRWHECPSSLQWTRDGTKLFSATSNVFLDSTICSWNPETGELVGEPWKGHTAGIVSISLSADGTKLASASQDKTVRCWDSSGSLIGNPLRHVKEVLAVSISPSNDFVASADSRGKISIWRAPWSTETVNQITPSLVEPTSYSPRTASSSRQAGTNVSSSTPLDLTPYIMKLGDRYLAGGSFGDVYRCRYNGPTGDIEVAVKSFRFPFTLGDGDNTTHAVKMVRRELGIWRRLYHPNIVPFLGTATGFGMEGSLALVSVWMPNGNLHKFLEDHIDQLQIAHQLQILWDIANRLDYLHSFVDSPIIHGDLNGNNVLVDGNFTARLVDFGYSTVVGGIPEALAYLQRSTARPGALRWSAPELVLAEEDETPERTPRSDIYSFGCLGLQVLSGKQPWSEVREEGAIAVRMVRGQKPKRPESRVMDDRHWEFIRSCWSSAEERPTAAMLSSFIQDFLGACPQSPSLRDMFPATLPLS